LPLTGQSALADASYMVSAPAKALIHSSVSDQNWKNCQLLRRRMAGFSAAVDMLLCRIEKLPPKLDLASYPYLPRANVATTSAASYMALMSEATR